MQIGFHAWSNTIWVSDRGNHPKIKDHIVTFSNQTNLESFITHVVHEDELEDPEVQNQKFSYFLGVVCPT